jgi:hypothetical protein
MSPVVKSSTVQQTTVSARKKTILEWEVLEPRPEPKAKSKARDKLSLCEVAAFEAYWLEYVGDDPTLMT